jgi:hypothetical protein
MNIFANVSAFLQALVAAITISLTIFRYQITGLFVTIILTVPMMGFLFALVIINATVGEMY